MWGYSCFISYPVAIVKQLFMGPWGQCIIHATLQPVWRTCHNDIHDWGNRSIVNYGSGGDVKEYICIRYEISMGQLNRFVYIYIFIQTNANVSRNIVCGPLGHVNLTQLKICLWLPSSNLIIQRHITYVCKKEQRKLPLTIQFTKNT